MTNERRPRGRPRKEPPMIEAAEVKTEVAEVATVAEPTFACRVLRDYWPEEDQRVRAGTIVHLDAAAAMDGVEAGILARVKD